MKLTTGGEHNKPMKILLYSLLLIIAGYASAFACSPLQISVTSDISLVSKSTDICGLSLNLPAGGNSAVTGLDIGFMSGTQRVNGMQANLLVNITSISDSTSETGVRGIQVAGLANILMGTGVKGIQVAGLFNSGGGSGVQVAGLYNAGMNDEVQIALFNAHDKEGYVLQLGIMNFSDTVKGIQCCGIFNTADSISGVQIGLVNRTTSPLKDYDPKIRAMARDPGSSMTGMQLGMVNLADSMTGVQFGMVNRSIAVRGLQVGIVNIANQLHGIQIGVLNINKRGPMPFLPVINMQF